MQGSSIEVVHQQSVRIAVEATFRNLRLFIAIAVTVLAVVAFVTLASKKQYRSEMKFLLENNRSNPVLTPDRSAAPLLAEITEQHINSELEVLASEDILNEVADPEWNSQSGRTPSLLKDHEQKINAFRKHLKIDPARKSNVIAISFTAPTQVEATDTLERFANAYLSHRKRLARPSGTSSFFADEASRYESSWKKAAADLVAFQRENHLVSVQEREQVLTKAIAAGEDDLRESEASMRETGGRLRASEQAMAQVPSRQQTQSHTISSQTAVDQMRTLLVQLNNRRTELLTRYTATDRLVREVEQQIADTSSALNHALAEKGLDETTDVNPVWQQVRNSLTEGKIEQQASAARVAATHATLLGLRSELSQAQQLDVTFNALQEKADQARSNYELFSEKRDQAQIEDAMDERKLINVAIAENATSAFHPVSPKPLLNTALGLLTALFLAAGAVYISEVSRCTYASPGELEASSNFPVLATVPMGTPSLAGGGADGRREEASYPIYRKLAVTQALSAMLNLRKANRA